jgi:hypothetical protein
MKNIARLVPLLPLTLITACGGSDSDSETTNDTQNQALIFPSTYAKSAAGSLWPDEDGLIYNREAVIPPQCYTKHEATYNPCMTCHQSYTFGSRPNQMDDSALQAEYAFSQIGETNHWTNLFEDRSEAVSQISDQEVIDSIYTDNYSTLVEPKKIS